MSSFTSDEINRATTEDRHSLSVSVLDRALIEQALRRWQADGSAPEAIGETIARVYGTRCESCKGAGFKVVEDDESACESCEGTGWRR